MPVYQFVCHDRVRDCDVWRYRSPVSLWVEWFAAWLERDRDARFGYRAWLYWQVAHEGSLVTKDMLTLRDEIRIF